MTEKKSIMRALVLSSSVLAVVLSVYYVIQSRIGACFNPLFLAMMLAGAVAALIHWKTGIYALLPVSGILLGVGFGVMVHDMLPSLSDVWNGVNFIGGNLTAYLIYTAISLAAAVIVIAACFRGTETGH